MQRNDSNGSAKRRPISARSNNPSGASQRGIETIIVEGHDQPAHPHCALPRHFFERSLALGGGRSASISVENWGISVKTR